MSELLVHRYELKYVVPAWQADAVREAIRPFCALDAHSRAAANGEYAIHSIYLDTPALDLYRLSRERRPRRLKLRVRGYGERPGDGPVFLEVKRKVHGLVVKSRAPVAGGWAARLAAPPPAGASAAERAFRDAVERHRLEPVLLVRYEREAWVSAVDAYARVTFDRRIACQPCRRLAFEAGPAAWLAVDDGRALRAVPRAIVLELKCTRDVPRWMARITERLGLQRVGISKYCTGVERARGWAALPRGPWEFAGGEGR